MVDGTFMAAEIREQPEVFRRVLRDLHTPIEQVVSGLRSANPRFVLFVARGTSDHAALYAKYLVETRLGLPAGLASPSSITIYGGTPRFTDTLVVAISQSGGSPDLVGVLDAARQAGACTLAVTNAPDSPVARAAELHLDILAGPERAVAATKSYTAQLLTLYGLIDRWAGGDGGDAAQLPERAEAILSRESEIAQIAERYRFAEQIVVTSRGYNYPTALESALKLMETSYLVAHAFSSADLLHGPMAMVDRGFPVIMAVPDGRVTDSLGSVLETLSSRGADTLVVGAPATAARGTVCFPIPDLGPEILSPMLLVLPLQLLAFHLARNRGVDPDQPRGLNKVTETW
jgi:glucosamine--fructose-6-phosphate aminotransferase (isomerizing)